MKDFGKLLKLTWKRYAIWIILFAFFFTLSNSFGIKNNLKWDERRLTDQVIEMERNLGKESVHYSDAKIDSKKLEEYEKTAQAFAKKYDLKDEEEKIYDDAYGPSYNEEKDELWDRYNTLDNFRRIMETYPDHKILVVEKFTSSMSITIFFIFILAMALTSIEESLNYYDFTRMLPWSKKKEFLMKLGISLIFGLGLFIVNALVTIAIIKGSVFSEIMSFAGFGKFLLKVLLSTLTTSLVGVSLGLLAGNFLGHIGLSIIAIGFIEWFKLIVFSFATIFGDDLSSRLNDAYIDFKNELGPAAKVFLSLTNTDFDKMSALWAALAVGLIISIGAYFLIGRSSAERSGYMVKNKALSEFCKWSGILSLTSLLYVITTGFITVDSFNIIVRIITYCLSLLISYKLFDILFKIRLKF